MVWVNIFFFLPTGLVSASVFGWLWFPWRFHVKQHEAKCPYRKLRLRYSRVLLPKQADRWLVLSKQTKDTQLYVVFFLWFILRATNQHLPVYRDRGIPFSWVPGMQRGHCEQLGAHVPTILCISHFLLLFLLLLQLGDFPSDSKVAPLTPCKQVACSLQAQVEHMILSTCPNCQHLPTQLLLTRRPDFSA